MADKIASKWWMSPAFKYVWTAYYLVAGLILIFLMTFAAPSFGYIPCAVLFAVSAILWKWPRQGAAFSAPFVAVFVFSLFKLEVWRWKDEEGTAAALLAVVIASCIPCVTLLVSDQISWRTMLVAASLVVVAFAVDRLWTNKVEIRSVEMEWTADGKTPWSDVVQLDAMNRPPVVVYVRSGGGYCYDALFYEPLRERLRQIGARKIMVRYDVFKEFGRERGYNIREIAGFQFNNGERELIPNSEGFGGTMLEQKTDGRNYGSLSCPR